MDDHSDAEDANGDGEGVWSPDIEQCFREALLLFPPCGRRKHILQEEGGGKMYGRNELIARHIMMRTGKVRTRKQVSSHIQVLARRKAKAEATPGGNGGGSSSPASSMNSSVGTRINRLDLVGSNRQQNEASHHQQQQTFYDVWMDRPIVTQKIRLVEFSAFIEYRQPSLRSAAAVATASVGQICAQTDANKSNLQAAALANLAATAIATCDPVFNQHGQTQPTGQLAGSARLEAVSPFGGAGSGCNALASSSPNALPVNQQSASVATLGSSHLLGTVSPHQQFNQATSYPNGVHLQTHNHHNQQPLNNNQQHHHQLNQRNQEAELLLGSSSPHLHMHQQPSQASVGFTRHSYVKIDYTQPIGRQTNKLEKIDISQIQDKFPEISGPEGLFQRGPSDAFFLVKFWADLNNDYEYNIEDQNSYFGFSSHFETTDPYKDITCSTKACSYGHQVVEKVEKIYYALNNSNGRYSYAISRSPMCEFMIQFIKKLRQLPRAAQMNSVLENFTVLQVITNGATSEVLLCLAYVFEIASQEQSNTGSQYHVYKLTKD